MLNCKTCKGDSCLGQETLQRIADACEAMTKDREKLERNYKYMRNERDAWQRRAERAERSAAAYKGHCNRLKREV